MASSIRKEIPELTGLRGVAAYAVFCAHTIVFAFGGQQHPYLMGLAHFGMSLFFVLSGVVIAYNYSNVRGLSGSWRFFVARFGRLYPLYIFVLVVCQLRFPDPSSYDAFFFDPFAAATAITLTQSWFNVAGISGSAFGQSWSISSEWFLYAIFPLLALIPIRRPLLSLVVLLLTTFAAFAVLFTYQDAISAWLSPFVRDQPPLSAPIWVWLTYFSPFLRIFQFMAGILVCHSYLELRHRAVPFPNAILAWCFAGIASIIAIYPYFNGGGWVFDMLHTFAFIPSAAFGILVLCLTPSPVSWLLSSRLFRLLGEISYSVYALQFLALAEMSRYMEKGVLFCISSVGLVSVLSMGTYWLYERPTRHLLRALLLRPTGRQPVSARTGTFDPESKMPTSPSLSGIMPVQNVDNHSG
jgi:peptidoglycan/LPS O-acetylase OafA/YrhL